MRHFHQILIYFRNCFRWRSL